MPYQSCLMPYINEIVALRRKKPPLPFSQIAELLREKYEIRISRESVYRFIRSQAKGYKTCKYAWDVKPANANSQSLTAETSLPQKQTVLKTPIPSVSEKPAPIFTGAQKSDKFQYTYSRDHNNLTRLSPEEAAAERAKLKNEMENR